MASVVGVLLDQRRAVREQLTQANINILNERVSDDGLQVLIWCDADDTEVVRALEAHGSEGYNRIH